MQNKYKILIVEDETDLAQIIARAFTAEGFETHIATNGEIGLRSVESDSFDVIISDVMMPRLDGFSMVRRLRAKGIYSPILFLSARTQVDDIVEGFEVGGCDYIRKPFEIKELMVRVRSLIRAHSMRDATEFMISGKYYFNSETGVLRLGNTELLTSGKETQVLRLLCLKENEVVSNRTILEAVWGDNNFFSLRSLNVYIARLRKKLAIVPSVEIITYRNIGYKLRIRV